jgi:hypothetical protein
MNISLTLLHYFYMIIHKQALIVRFLISIEILCCSYSEMLNLFGFLSNIEIILTDTYYLQDQRHRQSLLSFILVIIPQQIMDFLLQFFEPRHILLPQNSILIRTKIFPQFFMYYAWYLLSNAQIMN